MKKISIIIFLLFSLSFYINVMHPIIPISYDEAWNWTYIASNGPWYALTNYPAANNHVFFTFIQSFITPRFLLWYFPEISRLLNVILGISLVVVIWIVFGRLLKNKSIWLLLGISVVCFFVSPLTTLFFIVARGYLLATFLLFSGIYVISQRKYFTASVFFILSGWAILTYTYTIPLIYTAAFLFAKKTERKKVILSVLIIPVALLVCYHPILSAVLIQGKIWPTGTLQNFLYATWQSISNFPYLPYDKIIFFHMPQEIMNVLYLFLRNSLNFIYTILYLMICTILFRSKSIPVKRFFFLLNSSIVSYLFMVILLSSFHISNVPFQRVGLFIPLFIAITIVGGIFYVKSLQLKLVFSLLVFGNLVIGLYFFSTKLPLRLNNPYPILSDYIVPIPFPVSAKERVQLQENQIKALMLVHPLDDSVVAYFSYIYKVPMVNLIPKVSTASALKNSKGEAHTVAIPIKREPHIFLLPDSPFFILEKVEEQVILKVLSFSDDERKIRIQYLVYLSDISYAQADVLWEKGNKSLSMKTFARGENDITMAIAQLRILVAFQGLDDVVFQDILSSIDLHQRILEKLSETNKQKFAFIMLFLHKNLHTLQSFSLQQ